MKQRTQKDLTVAFDFPQHGTDEITKPVVRQAPLTVEAAISVPDGRLWFGIGSHRGQRRQRQSVKASNFLCHRAIPGLPKQPRSLTGTGSRERRPAFQQDITGLADRPRTFEL